MSQVQDLFSPFARFWGLKFQAKASFTFFRGMIYLQTFTLCKMIFFVIFLSQLGFVSLQDSRDHRLYRR